MKRLTNRLAKLERIADQISDDHQAKLLKLQAELNLPLPEAAPSFVRNEGFLKLTHLQSAIRADPNNQAAVDDFKAWALEMRQKYRDA